jgi:hypothetical protein
VSEYSRLIGADEEGTLERLKALRRELTPLGDLAILDEDRRHLDATPLENGEAEAKTAFLVYRSHLETDHQLLSGCREDVLRRVEGAWKVARRTIVLDANVLLDKNLSVFLKRPKQRRAEIDHDGGSCSIRQIGRVPADVRS